MGSLVIGVNRLHGRSFDYSSYGAIRMSMSTAAVKDPRGI